MSTLYLDLPAEVAATAYARIDRDARALRNGGDQRTLEQLRADIAADLLLGPPTGSTGRCDASGRGGSGRAGAAQTRGGSGCACGAAATNAGPGVGALVYLHMPIDTALTMGDDGAELSGYGPLPGPIARDIATHPQSIWRKVLTDPATGVAQDISRRRQPTQAMRELVAARDRECPYCHRPAQRCDFDHLAEWSTSRETSARNGGAKCEFHHYLKDEPGWRLDYDPTTHAATITTPTGRTYTKRNRVIRGQKADAEPKSAPDIRLPQQRGPTTAASSPAAPPPTASSPADSPPGDDPPF